jgi:heme exporter protein B
LGIVSFGIVVFIFNVPNPSTLLKIIYYPFLLGSFGFVFVGTTFSVMLTSHERKDLVLPLISYPVLVPIVLGVMKVFVFSATGDLLGTDDAWIRILEAFDAIYFILSLMVIEVLINF